MATVQIFWDPQGLSLDTLGSKDYQQAIDGDTVTITTNIRMLSIDTPETHYPSGQSAAQNDQHLAQLAAWIREGRVPVADELAAYLAPRLAVGAGTLQQRQGEQAHQALQQIISAKLQLSNGKQRHVFIRTAGQTFDSYGRLLAYVAPNYNEKELATLSRKARATFNLLMVESGWAAPFPIYPSLPRYEDLQLLHDAARQAYETKQGAWSELLMLTGYEFRMCVRLYEVTRQLVNGKKLNSAERNGWVTRYCADLITREIFYPQQYLRVPPANRLFIEPADVNTAAGRLNLLAPAA